MSAIKTINVSSRHLSGALDIGKRGENEVTQIVFDFSSWKEEFGNGVVSLFVKRSQDANAYPVALVTSGNTATWLVSSTDTAYVGAGKAEFDFSVDSKLAKSVVFKTRVSEDIGAPSATPPDPYESWLDTLTELGAETQQNAEDAADSAAAAEEAANHYPQIIDDYWWVWDVDEGEYVNTGVKASGGGVGGAVDSVNGKTGVVVLDASDVGALPENTTIPLPQLLGTPAPLGVANRGTAAEYSRADHIHPMPSASDIGAYVKPASGIPASDLAAGVIPTVPSASDATPQALGTAASGSSADFSRADHVHEKSTYSKSDVGLGNVDNVQQYSASNPPPYPVSSVNSKTGAVTLNASDIGAGTYSKPSGGIPKSDLASAVQASLDKADSALQSAPVSSVNGQTGAVSLTIPSSASDVGAVASNQGIGNAGKFLVVGSDGVVTPVTMTAWQGGSY